MDPVYHFALASTDKYPWKIPIQNEYFVGYPSKVAQTRASLSADARKSELRDLSSLFILTSHIRCNGSVVPFCAREY